MTGADPSQKAIHIWLVDLAVKRCANHAKGLSPALVQGHRFTAKLMRNRLFSELDLIAHDVVANPCKFVTQRSGGQYRIGLGRLAIIVAAKAAIEAACHLRGFRKCPTQIAIAVFAVATAFAFSVG
jgi:hypothetical protein